MKKRRHITTWYEQRIAKIDHECARCDTTIHANSNYEREVYVNKNRIEIEKFHSTPTCSSRYYTGN